MDRVSRLNFKYLIKDQGKKTELFQKLKKGQTVNARVSSYENGKALISIKGTDILVKVNRELLKGELIKLKIDDISEDKIIMSVQDDKTATSKVKNSLLSESSLKTEILAQAMNDKIYLDDEKTKKILEKYKKYKEKFPEKTKVLLKSLIKLEDAGLKDSEKILEKLSAYFSEEELEELKIGEKWKEKIKDLIKKAENTDKDEKKGQDIVNSINKLKDKNEIEFITGLYSANEKAKIKINYDEKTKDGKIDIENLYVSINLELEKLGDLEIKISIWKKNIELIFMVEEGFEKKEILKNVENLKSRIKKTGFNLNDVKVKVRNKKEYSLKGVNLKI